MKSRDKILINKLLWQIHYRKLKIRQTSENYYLRTYGLIINWNLDTKFANDFSLNDFYERIEHILIAGKYIK